MKIYIQYKITELKIMQIQQKIIIKIKNFLIQLIKVKRDLYIFIEEQKAINIIDYIEDYINIYGIQLSGRADNGKKFKNKLISD